MAKYIPNAKIMYPQEEFGKVVEDIRDAVTRIGVSKDNNEIVCRELMNVSMDLNKASALIEHGKQLKRIPMIRAEAKLFLSLTSTIEHWARFKSWDELCGTLSDVSEDILRLTAKIGEMLMVKQAQANRERSKKKKQKHNTKKGEHDEWVQEKHDIRDEMVRLREDFAEKHAEREALIPGITQSPVLPSLLRNIFK